MCRNQVFLIFPNNRIFKLNLKNPTHAFVEIAKKKMCAKCHQKIMNCRVVRARHSFRFFRQNTWFHENNRALPKF